MNKPSLIGEHLRLTAELWLHRHGPWWLVLAAVLGGLLSLDVLVMPRLAAELAAAVATTTGGTLTLNDLKNINSSTTGAAVGPTVINARKLDTDADLLANPRIRARNREKAKILIGDRVPNITSTITSTGFSSESITYIDVGLKLDIEPTIYLDNEVAMKVTLEVSNIVDKVQTKTGTVAYQIGTRSATSVLRLKDGENQLLAGLISNEDRRTANKIPFLGDIPILGRLFGSHNDEDIKTEIVLSITPHILRNIRPAESYLAEFEGGTETSFRARPEGGMAAGTASGQPSDSLVHGARPAILPAPTAAIPSSLEGAAPAVLGNPSGNSLTPSSDAAAAQAGSVFSGGGLAGASSGGTAQLLWQGPTQLKVGETVALQLVMQADRPVVSVPLAVGFDPRLLQVVDASEGPFLKQGGAATTFTYRVDPGGQLLLTTTRSGAGGASGPDVLATMTFRALTTGSSRVELITTAPVGTGGATINAALPTHLTLTVSR